MILHEPDPSHWANVGCRAWWPVMPGEAYSSAGGIIADLVGGKHLHLVRASGSGGVPWSNSVRPGSLGDASIGPFSLSSGTITYYGSSGLNLSTACPTAGTISAWIMPTVAANAVPANVQVGWQGSSPTYFEAFISESGNSIFFGMISGGVNRSAQIATNSTFWNIGQWLHLCGTWAISDYARLYINGSLSATASNAFPSSMPALALSFLLGGSSYSGSPGASAPPNQIDDVCVWSYKMSAAQVARVYSESRWGWPGRLIDPTLRRRVSLSNIYRFTGIGGMPQGGYPDRTSSWIMPGIGGLTDGGHASPATTFGPEASGGLIDGGDTAAPLTWDTFTGTAGTLLTAHASDDGGAWTKHPNYSSGDARLDGSGAVYSTATTDGVFLHSHVPASADYVVSCDCTHASSGSATLGVCARWNSSANTGYFAYLRSTSPANVYLAKYVAGSFTSLANASVTWTVGQTKRLSLFTVGTSLRVYFNDSLVLGPITDSSISSAGQAGIIFNSSYVSADNWTSSAGGVQARYALPASGGEEFGGFAPGGNFYVQPCSGGVYQGGKRLGPVMDYGPSATGGTHDGGFVGPHLLIVETATGGTETGGEVADVYVVIATSGGMAAGGKRLGPVMDYGPYASGGIYDGGLAESNGVYVIEPAGGQHLGGTSQIILGILYRLYANDGAGGPIDYSTVIAATASLNYVLDPLTGPGVWSFGVRAYDTDLNLEDLNVDAVVTVRLDAASHDITNIPAPPLTLTGHAGPAGSAVLSWQYQQPDPGKAPTGFRVYQGTGSVNYSSPVATVPWGGRSTLSATIPGLTDSTTYLFGVRAYNATGEEPNTSTVSITAKVSAPSAPASITISAVA